MVVELLAHLRAKGLGPGSYFVEVLSVTISRRQFVLVSCLHLKP